MEQVCTCKSSDAAGGVHTQLHSSCTNKSSAWEAKADDRHSHLKLRLLNWQVVESCGEPSLLRRIGNFSTEQVGELPCVFMCYKHFAITSFLDLVLLEG